MVGAYYPFSKLGHNNSSISEINVGLLREKSLLHLGCFERNINYFSSNIYEWIHRITDFAWDQNK